MAMDAAGYFGDWFKSQEKFVQSWIESTGELRHALLTPQEKQAQRDDIGKLFLKLYNTWLSTAAHSIPDTKYMNMSVLKDAMLKSCNGQNVYLKLYEVWMPLFQAMQERVTDPGNLKKILDPVQLKEVIDKTFGFSPDGIKELSSQTSKVYDTWSIAATEFLGPWMDGVQENIKNLPQLIQGHPESLTNIFHNVFNSYDSTFGRLFHVRQVGKDREKIELLLRGMDDLSVFLSRAVKYQYVMYMTGLKAAERVVEVFASRIKDNEIHGFNEFFDLWIDVSEKKYLELGKTKEYAMLQGELMNSSMTVRGHYFKLMELYLYDVPVALRSEMDDLYKTIYVLKKKLRALQRQVDELSAAPGERREAA
ncbi:MAG: poly(R)-hydroxyalkanoic acid synthase subunit PhaE [Nitrospirota bacterium]